MIDPVEVPCRRRRVPGWLGAVLALSLASAITADRSAQGANTEPTLALMRAAAVRAPSGRVTVKLEGSFSFADTVQLGLPVEIEITQASRVARCTLSGDVTLSTDGGGAQPAPPPCVLGVTDRIVTLALPAGFAAGDATAQLLLVHEGRQIASNRLGFRI